MAAVAGSRGRGSAEETVRRHHRRWKNTNVPPSPTKGGLD
jgi:hypothetical protein